MSHILIVEDEQDVVAMLQFMLEKDGHSVSTAANGVQALAILGVQPPNPEATLPALILMDIMMPELNGQETCLRLAGSPRTKAVPIIVLSGRCETRGALTKMPNVVAFLTKPFDPKKIRDILAKTLPR